MTRGIHKMLANHIPLFVCLIKLLIFFNGQQKINCDITVLAADACKMNNVSEIKSKHRGYKIDYARAITPDCAGREGVKIVGRSREMEYDDDAFFTGSYDVKPNVSFSLKFFIKMEPNDQSNFEFACIEFAQALNGSIQLTYRLTGGDIGGDIGFIFKSFSVEIPKTVCTLENDDQSDWTPLIGMKLKVSERKKRAAPSGDKKNNQWIMIGFEHVRHLDMTGYFNFYLNGKNVHTKNITEHSFIRLSSKMMGEIGIENAQISCMEYSTEAQDPSYFTDPALRECMKEYEGKPEEDFEDCSVEPQHE